MPTAVPLGRGRQSGGVLVVRLCPWRQLNPRMPATVVDVNLAVGESLDRRRRPRRHPPTIRRDLLRCGTRLSRRPGRTDEPGPVVTNANVLSCGAEDLIGRGEGGQRGKHTARPTLTGEAVAHADAERLALNFDTQLTAGTRGCPGTHRGTSWDVVREPSGLAGGLLVGVMLSWESGNAPADCGAT